MLPSIISHYEILNTLGEGGMGVVYKAHDMKLDRFVALKFLPPQVASSVEDRARFIQEAKAVAATTHANICTVHSVEEQDGHLFIVMEYVEGKSLREMLQNLPVKRAIDIGTQIAEGLAAAHAKGIVHRDIKPENIMVRNDGRVQVMDFGLAKLRGVSRLTREGSTLGTAGYMSPEQIQGQEADHRSDIFSLGVVLYEMFAGESPFKGVHETALSYEIVNTYPLPPSAVRPEVDLRLDAIVLECLEKDVSERYQSVAEVAKDLRHLSKELTRSRADRIPFVRAVSRQVPDTSARTDTIAPSAIPAWKKYIWPVIAAASIASLIVVTWSPWERSYQSRTVTRAEIALPGDQSLSTIWYAALAISPDGSLIVYKANGQLYVRRLDSFISTPVPGTEGATSPFISWDGKWIGFFEAGKMKKVPVSGGAAITLADALDNRGATWGASGDIVFEPYGGAGLLVVREGTGEVRALTTIDSTKSERTHRWPSFLPDGKTVIFTVGTADIPDSYDDAAIEAVDVGTGARKILLKGGCFARYAPAGFLVYWRSGSLFAVPFDPGKLEVTGASVPVVENVNGDPTTGMAAYAIAQNGTLVYIPGKPGATNLSMAKVDLHGVMTPFPAPPQSYMEPRVSPDGRRIAVTIQSGRDTDIWIYDIDRNTLRKLTFGGKNRTPAWSPDGKRIAYNAVEHGEHFVIVRQADGGGVPEVAARGLGRMYIDDWSRDGSSFVLDVEGTTRTGPNGPGGSDLFVLPLGGDHTIRPFLETEFDESQASLSPDGKWIAYSSNESGSYRVYVQPFPRGGGRHLVSSNEGSGPHWAPDGNRLYYYSAGSLVSVPLRTSPSFEIGKPQTILSGYQQYPVDSGLMYDIFPDGHSLVILKSKDDQENLRRIHLVLNWFDEIQGMVR